MKIVFHYCSALVLAPLLLRQGKHVRRHTLRLPEATGERSGVLQADNPDLPKLRLLIAGDSAAAGVGAALQTDALAGRLVEQLADYAVEWHLEAKTGLTAAQILARLKQQQSRELDVVLLSMGVNDVTQNTSLKVWKQTLIEVLNTCREQFKAPRVIFTAVPPMEKFPALPQPLRWFLGTRATLLNQALQEVCQQEAQASVLNVNFPIATGVMAEDGFHPGPVGYQLWAREAARTIRLTQSSSV
ncbi:MAG: SGNH/GDSL hydrolase family protein [Idiomarina sp.]|nr:SGNH/GDSL hydrolase family protein [Idiomarina sp.]